MLFIRVTVGKTEVFHCFSCLVIQDIHLLDLEDFQYSGVNITAYQLVNPESPLVIDVLSDWQFDRKLTGRSPLANELGFSVSFQP